MTWSVRPSSGRPWSGRPSSRPSDDDGRRRGGPVDAGSVPASEPESEPHAVDAEQEDAGRERAPRASAVDRNGRCDEGACGRSILSGRRQRFRRPDDDRRHPTPPSSCTTRYTMSMPRPSVLAASALFVTAGVAHFVKPTSSNRSFPTGSRALASPTTRAAPPRSRSASGCCHRGRGGSARSH